MKFEECTCTEFTATPPWHNSTDSVLTTCATRPNRASQFQSQTFDNRPCEGDRLSAAGRFQFAGNYVPQTKSSRVLNFNLRAPRFLGHRCWGWGKSQRERMAKFSLPPPFSRHPQLRPLPPLGGCIRRLVLFKFEIRLIDGDWAGEVFRIGAKSPGLLSCKKRLLLSFSLFLRLRPNVYPKFVSQIL